MIKETLRLAECANIIMEEFFLLRLIMSFIDALYWIIPTLGGLHSSLPSPELCVTQNGMRDTGDRPGLSWLFGLSGGCWDQFQQSPAQGVNYILESRASTARADYFAQKQRKLSRRTSFSFQKEKKSGQQ
ncbi:hypothetical protein IHE44_0007304 [Lamprotornis superbus]|uniref:Uncharacterized protein n=1 Tax=Lamprotornis superbus TaxID=245042 RepID=A0A835NUY8_9PASS|nr:hypothetical protein IHE44_0007304 [Lamprotornis superbus]